MNTIGDWNDRNGYKIKVTENVNLSFSGYDMVDHTLALDAGWNLIPVISSSNVSADALFGSLGNNLIIAKEVAGSHVYWPGEGVESLENLNPGKSYLVKMEAPATITFPQAKTNLVKTTLRESSKLKSTSWESCIPTGNSHVISIPATALGDPLIQPGDFILAYTSTGICAGQIELTDLSQNYALVLFGDDSLTSMEDGFFAAGEIHLRLYSTYTSWEWGFEVIYDDLFPDDGQFVNEGLSKVGIMWVITGIEENQGAAVQISPNPASEKTTISGIEKWPVNIQIVDVKGQQVISINNLNRNEVDVSGLKDGLYFIRITSNDWSVVRKLVVK
jgi:hypothetical protein